jgi:response regulator of citrate/malate metabolism
VTSLRVLVVDDDFRVARVHAELVARVPGFEVAAVAHTAAEALALAAQERPDLVVLDEYLPDERGSSLLRRLGAAAIVVTAADDRDAVRRALAAGAVNIVLKPFAPPVLQARVAAFGRFAAHLAGSGQVDQTSVDRAMAALHEGDSPAALPKGRSAVTALAIRDVLRASAGALTAAEVAEATGVSRATAQRYLADLASSGRVELTLRYGTTGRPEHRYVWRG